MCLHKFIFVLVNKSQRKSTNFWKGRCKMAKNKKRDLMMVTLSKAIELYLSTLAFEESILCSIVLSIPDVANKISTLHDRGSGQTHYERGHAFSFNPHEF